MENKVQITLEAADKTRQAYESVKKNTDSMISGFQGLALKVTAFTAAAAVTVGVMNSFVKEAAEAEQVENRLRFALESVGYQWSVAKSAVDEFATSLQNTTRFSDEQARQALTDMMLYTTEFAKAQMGAKLAMDMSIRTGQDLHSTSRLIGMAMSGNVEMLGRYIPSLRNVKDRLGENATATQVWEYALKELQKLFGGTAQADVSTYAGRLAQLKNTWSETKEAIGNLLIGPAGAILTWLKVGAEGAKAFADELGKMNDQLIKGQGASLEDQIRKLQAKRETLRVGPSGGVLKLFGYEREKEISDLTTEIERKRKELENLKESTAKKLATQGGKDTFADTKKEAEDVLSYSQLMYEAWKELYFAEFTARQEAYDERQWWNSYGKEQLETWFRWEKEATEKHQKEMLDMYEERQWWKEYGEAQMGTWAEWEAKDIAEGLERSRDAHEEWKERYLSQTKSQASEIETVWKSFSESIGSVWANNVSGMIKGAQDMKEALRNIWSGMADAFISSVAKMITQWLLFGSITGKKEEGGGFLTGGSWGGLLGGVLSLFKHGGGIVGEGGPTVWAPAAAFTNAPRLHGGFAPNEYPAVLQKGEGVFTPGQMKAMGGGQTTNIYFINPVGEPAFFERNMRTIIEGVSKDARRGGAMKATIRSYG
jgi:hypothetical protein